LEISQGDIVPISGSLTLSMLPSSYGSANEIEAFYGDTMLLACCLLCGLECKNFELSKFCTART